MSADHEQTNVPAEPQKRGRLAAAFAVGLLLAVAAGSAVWFLVMRGEPEVLVQAPVAPAPAAAPAPKTAPLEGSDEAIREWVARLALPPLFAPFFEANDVARRIVSVVYNVAEGNSPRQLLGFLKPEGAFEVEQKGGALVIPAKTFARYDAFAAAFSALDAKLAAQAWTTLEPIFEAAHQEIAPPGRTVRQSLDSALTALLAVPSPDGDVAVVPGKGALYALKDPALESLTPAQKHLLRMGPANVRSIQAKLRELQTSLAADQK